MSVFRGLWKKPSLKSIISKEDSTVITYNPLPDTGAVQNEAPYFLDLFSFSYNVTKMPSQMKQQRISWTFSGFGGWLFVQKKNREYFYLFYLFLANLIIFLAHFNLAKVVNYLDRSGYTDLIILHVYVVIFIFIFFNFLM